MGTSQKVLYSSPPSHQGDGETKREMTPAITVIPDHLIMGVSCLSVNVLLCALGLFYF